MNADEADCNIQIRWSIQNVVKLEPTYIETKEEDENLGA
jgi:hypothetical protein